MMKEVVSSIFASSVVAAAQAKKAVAAAAPAVGPRGQQAHKVPKGPCE